MSEVGGARTREGLHSHPCSPEDRTGKTKHEILFKRGMSVPQLNTIMSDIFSISREVSRVPAPFSARRFTDSDDEVGGLPEKPLCRVPGGEDMTRGVQRPRHLLSPCSKRQPPAV